LYKDNEGITNPTHGCWKSFKTFCYSVV